MSNRLRRSGTLRPMNSEGEKIINESGGEHQQAKAIVPPAIEKIACAQEQHVLP